MRFISFHQRRWSYRLKAFTSANIILEILLKRPNCYFSTLYYFQHNTNLYYFMKITVIYPLLSTVSRIIITENTPYSIIVEYACPPGDRNEKCSKPSLAGGIRLSSSELCSWTSAYFEYYSSLPQFIVNSYFFRLSQKGGSFTVYFSNAVFS